MTFTHANDEDKSLSSKVHHVMIEGTNFIVPVNVSSID